MPPTSVITEPTYYPTAPTSLPTMEPTDNNNKPTDGTLEPTYMPTAPTSLPTSEPNEDLYQPTAIPTEDPTKNPTQKVIGKLKDGTLVRQYATVTLHGLDGDNAKFNGKNGQVMYVTKIHGTEDEWTISIEGAGGELKTIEVNEENIELVTARDMTGDQTPIWMPIVIGIGGGLVTICLACWFYRSKCCGMCSDHSEDYLIMDNFTDEQ